MIRLADGIEYVEMYLTLLCNLRCPYCINGDTKRNRMHADPLALAEAISQIDFRGMPLTIGGGEPTTRPEFADFVNNLRPDIKIDLLTNGQFDPVPFAMRIPPDRFYRASDETYKSIRISYHTQCDAVELALKAEILISCGFNVGIFGIAHPDSLVSNMRMAEHCRKHGIFFFVKEYLGEHEGQMYGHYRYPDGYGKDRGELALCRGSEVLIGPDGDIYRCHRDLYAGENMQGNILAYEREEIPFEYRYCDKYGMCNLCDLKIKISPDFERSRCSVEVKGV